MVFCFENCFSRLREKKCYSDPEKKLFKFEAEGRELAKALKSLKQIIQTVKGQNNFKRKCMFLEVSKI